MKREDATYEYQVHTWSSLRVLAIQAVISREKHVNDDGSSINARGIKKGESLRFRRVSRAVGAGPDGTIGALGRPLYSVRVHTKKRVQPSVYCL